MTSLLSPGMMYTFLSIRSPYEVDAFFWYKAIFIIELLCAEFLITFRIRHKNYFALRALGSAAVCIGLAFAVPVFDDGAFYAVFLFLTLFIVTLFALRFCFDADLKTIIFCGLAGYATQHIAFELFDIASIAMGVHNMSETTNLGSNPFSSFVLFVYGSNNSIVANAFIVIVYYAIMFVTYWFVVRTLGAKVLDFERLKIKNGTVVLIFTLVITFNIIISAFVTEYADKNYQPVYLVILDITNIFCCLLALYRQFGLAKFSKMNSDIESINRMWEQSKQQYDLTKKNIDLINMKCHDLKHQIRKMGRQNALDPSVLGEMTDIISVYDSGVETGNDALDVIISEKSLYCSNNNIPLSCIADGAKLSFMSEADLYAMFGNALDNAIEATEKLEPDQRVIGMTVKQVNAFVVINVYNSFKGEVKLVNGLISTTKSDVDYHGFGIKSIKMLVEKYGGEIKINAVDGIFDLNIIFPIND